MLPNKSCTIFEAAWPVKTTSVHGRQAAGWEKEAGELYMYNPASQLGQTQLTGIMLAWTGPSSD